MSSFLYRFILSNENYTYYFGRPTPQKASVVLRYMDMNHRMNVNQWNCLSRSLPSLPHLRFIKAAL